MTTELDSCPRCGYVLDQPAPPSSPSSPSPLASPSPVHGPPPVASYAPAYPAPQPRPRPTQPPPTMSAASVPKILLGLGAACLLVAAVIFLAVAWSWLGVGGRTAVLVVLTVTTALAGQWLSRRELAVAAEALTTVALGLVVLDHLGARGAGWLGSPDVDSFATLLGGVLLGVSLALSLPARRLVVPQLTAPVGLGLLAVAVEPTTGHPQALAAGSVLVFAGLVVLGRACRLTVLPWSAAAGALGAYLALVGQAVVDAVDHPTLRELWLGRHGAGMVAVAALVLLPWALAVHVRSDADDVRQLCCAASVSVLSVTVAIPVFDEGATAVTLAAAAATSFWAVVSAAAPPRWYVVPRVPLVGSALVLLPVPVALAAAAATNLVSVAEPFTADVTVRLDPATPAHPLLLPLGTVVVVLAAFLTRPRTRLLRIVSGTVLAVTALLTAALFPLPLWLFVAPLGPFGLLLSPPSAVLTLLVLGEIVLLLAAALVRRVAALEPVAGGLLPIALAAFVWTGGHVTGQPFADRALVTLVALSLLAITLPRPQLELGAAVAVVLSSASGISASSDQSVALATHLTLAGGAVTISSLVHRDHRDLGWLGGFLLAAATWVRLYDVGVRAPEAYTLPTAVALVLVGLHRLHRDADADTSTSLLPGLSLATLPTLLWALADPLSTRAVVIGLAALALLLGGAALRWTAPVLVGWVCGGLLVLRELAPYAAQTPQWILIGAAGTLLVATGITWESRMRDLRHAAGYLAHLR